MQRERKKVYMCVLPCTFLCVCGCMSVCICMTAFRAALLGQLILSHLRSWVRIIKPISRRWLLQPACDWITTEPPPSALQRERAREEKNETQGKEREERRGEINKESRQREASGGWKRRQRESIRSRTSVLSTSKSYLLSPALTADLLCVVSVLVTFHIDFS